MTERFMMATAAHHKTGDVSRDRPDLAVIHDETDDVFIGQWVAGFGFINVEFPKGTTRELTDDERRLYAGKVVELAGRISPTGVTVEDGDDAVAGR